MKANVLSLLTTIALATAFSPIAVVAEPGPDLGRRMGFRLFDLVCAKSQPNENVLLSPSSAYTALSMVTNGASGETLKQLLQALNFKKDIDSLNATNLAGSEAAKQGNSGVILESANGIFCDKDLAVAPAFVQTCRKFYSAEVRSLDFGKANAVTEINAWCSDKTHKKINSLLTKVSKSDLMVLINALYFKGTWESTFKHESTHPDTFTLESGKTETVEMMNQMHPFNYFEGDAFSAIAMPYKDSTVRMVVLLPNKGTTVGQLRARLNEENWNSWMSKFKMESTHVKMPKFKIEFSKILNGTLQEMGVKDAFDSKKANFSALVKKEQVPKPFIGIVLQKTFMEVNEQGTEAAAATAIMMVGAGMPMKSKEFSVDHPFIIALCNDKTKEILFLGQVSDPKGGNKN